jgi:ferritin
MIGKVMTDGFNKQINAETFSAYLYWSMAAQFDGMGLEGFASWMKCQAQEEMVHAMKFYTHILDRDGKVVLTGLDDPQVEWSSPQEIFEDAYKHEQKITGMINDLCDLADKEKDRAAMPILQWFVDEQVEEEKSVKDVLDKLEMVKDAKGGIYMLDKEMGQRTFNPSAEGEE